MIEAKQQVPSRLINRIMLLCLFVLPMWRVGYYDTGLFSDDAGIVFVYARNLIESGQIFYNFPVDRLDGFTSTIDVLFAIPLYVLGSESMFVWNYYLKALITSVVPIFVFFAFVRWGLDRKIAFALAAVLAASNVLSAAFGMQLEGPLYAVAIIFFFSCLFDRVRLSSFRLAAIGILLCLTRPEALALVATALIAACIYESDKTRRGLVMRAGFSVAAVMAAWYGWRTFYFGYWAPNTYYAKLSGSRLQELSDGFSFAFYHFSQPDGFIYVAVIGFLLWSVRKLFMARSSGRETDFLIVALVASAMLAVRIWTGGDSYQYSARLLIDFAVPAFLALGLAIIICRHLVVRNLMLGMIGLALIGNGLFIIRNLPHNLAGGFVRMEREVNAGLVCERDALSLVSKTYPGARLAHTDFQRSKYYSPNMEVIDLSGLNNRDISHRTSEVSNVFGKHDLNYALERKAELWKMSTGVMERTPIHELDWPEALRSDESLRTRFRESLDFMRANYAAFSEGYAPLTVSTKCGTYLNLLVRRDLISADSVYLETH